MSEVLEKKNIDHKLMDFKSDQAVRWCPGCGTYGVLGQVRKIFPELGVARENFVFISGIGCSSRFPYYVNTYGFHTIHGRATAIASGVKLANPGLSVWVVTGDGDSLSIGGNHTIHLMRRNLDINILLLNNRIYGLTKGQYSPTSELGKVTKSTPMGSLDRPFNPPALALGAQASFVARTIDRDQAHIKEMVRRSYEHAGTSFLEIYQNCNIFNDGAFAPLTNKDTREDTVLKLEHDKPMIFGKEKKKGIRLEGNKPYAVDIGKKWGISDILVHDEKDWIKASVLAHFTHETDLPEPVGVFYSVNAPIYEKMAVDQIQKAKDINGKGRIEDLLNSGNTWVV